MLALANAADIAATVRWPPGGASVRAAHHAFDVAETLGVGLVCALLLGTLGHALRHRPRLGRLVYFAAGTTLAYLVLGQDLRHQADYVASGALGHLLFALFVGLCGAALPVAHGLGRWCGRRRTLRWAALALAVAAVATSHVTVRDDYAGLHAAVDWTAATIAFAALGRPVARLHGRRAWRAVIAAFALIGAIGIAVPPSNRTRLELFRAPGAIGAWAMTHTVWPRPPAVAGDRAAPPKLPEGPVPPSEPPLVEGEPVVVMITVDATRADVVLDKANAKALPFFMELGRSAATFTRAVSPGSQTSVSLTTMFSGRYFSQLYWARFGRGSSRFLYAAEDSTPRFVEILTEKGVETALFGGTNFLANEYGVARGFTSSKVPEGRKHAMAHDVLDPLIARLGRVGDGPAFLYAHIMEPHAPYDRAKKKGGTDFERYVAEVGLADTHVARVARALAQRFPTRGVLIVSADHGEAFGEHGTFHHTKTLYDELLRVPLFVRGAQVKARRIDARVSLVDIGPTVLDLFGIPAPAGFMGQSLVPILRGEDAPLVRPVLAEGRLRRALYAGNVKVIEDMRRKVVEAYDLERDPGELVNLFDDGDPRATDALAALRAFFDAHALRRPGYSPPYKP
jgi:arylsulfatase A-like enzyme